MNRVDHRLLGGSWGLAYGTALHALTGAPAPLVVGCGAVAALTAGGRLSPDIDQYWRTRRVQRRYRVLGVTWDLGERRVEPDPLVRSARWCWRAFARAMTAGDPERGRHGDPAQHRGVTHWWGAAVLASAALALLQLVGVIVGWGVPWWAGWAALLGWCSHLAGDFVHGRQAWGKDGPGIPLGPWWGHAGVGLKSDGWTAHVVAWGVAVPVGVLMVKVAAGI